MSQYPRRVLADVWMSWGESGNPPQLIRKGSLIDCPHGSQLEAALGGSSNLQDLSALQLGGGRGLNKAWLSNLEA